MPAGIRHVPAIVVRRRIAFRWPRCKYTLCYALTASVFPYQIGKLKKLPTAAAIAPDGLPIVDRHIVPGRSATSAHRLGIVAPFRTERETHHAARASAGATVVVSGARGASCCSIASRSALWATNWSRSRAGSFPGGRIVSRLPSRVSATQHAATCASSCDTAFIDTPHRVAYAVHPNGRGNLRHHRQEVNLPIVSTRPLTVALQLQAPRRGLGTAQ